MNWYLKVISENYANFKGRARRQEYWMFALFQVIIFTGIIFISEWLSGPDIDSFRILGFILATYFLGTITPTLAVISRRLHDIGKSGTYFFVYFIPFIGGIWFLVLMTTKGDEGANKYGPDPKSNFIDEIDDIGKP